MTKAVDVFAKYQGTINWRQVAAAGVTNVFVKLTNGPKAASPTGDGYVTAAHGQAMVVGGYHYALGGSASAQAAVFAAELVRLKALDLAPALDFEDATLPADNADRRAWIVAFFTALKARIPGLDRALLYSSGSELTAIHADTIGLPGLDILIWDAEYGPNDGSEHPVTHYTGRIAIHQYTSVGRISGIGTAVDVDTITADISAEDNNMDLTQANLDAIAHAVAAYKLNDADPDMHQHAVDATTSAKAVAALTTQVANLAKAVAALQSGQSGTLAGTYPATVTFGEPAAKGFAHNDIATEGT